ncbi:MAG: T9SS type A sorting domain-containing protein [Bacteroidota bacterium]
MKKRWYWLLPVVVIVVLWLGRVSSPTPPFSSESVYSYSIDWNSIDTLSVVSAVGTTDEPYARSEFERLRTSSPKTRLIPQNIRAKELRFAKKLPKSDVLTSFGRGRSTAVSFNFQSRGPVNVGGRTRALAIDVSDATGNTILAGGVSGGMWRTTDRGERWTRTTTLDQFPSVVSLVQDTRPGKQNIWYYGTGEVRGNSADGNGGALFRGDGIYKSEDSGQSWSMIAGTNDGDITNTDNPFRFVNRLVIDTTNATEDEMYAAVIDGIIRTTDGFQTHEFVLGNQTNVSLFTEVAITSTGKLYATVSDDSDVTNQDIGIWKSDDGIDWEEIEVPTGFPTAGFQRTSIGISPSNENLVYFFRTEASGDDYNLYVYNDVDQSIVARPQSTLPIDLGGPVGDLSTQSSYDQYIKVHPNNSDIVFLGAVNLYRSTNGFTDDSETQWIGGYSFKSNEEGNVALYHGHHPDQHELVFFPNNPNQALTANDGGISMTDNVLKSSTTESTISTLFGAANEQDEVTVIWNPIDSGYQTGQFYTIAINENDVNFPWVVGGLQDNSTHLSDTDDGQNSRWGDVFGGDGSYTQLTFNSLIASAQFAQAARLNIIAEQGNESGSISPPSAGEGSSYLFVNPILSDPVILNKVFIASRGEIFYTNDVTQNPRGDEWLSFGDGTIPNDHFVTAMDASISPGHQLVFSSNNRAGDMRVFRVEDTNNPTDITELTGSNLPGGFVNSIEINPRNASDISLVFSNYDIISIFNTQDGGISWTPIAGNLEENPDGSGNGVSVRWMEIMPNGTGNIYLVGTSAGLYYTETLSGMSTVWTQAGESTIGDVVVDMIAVRPIDGFMAVATHGNGVFQASLDVPLQANIYADVSLCSNAGFTVLANRTNVAGGFSYEWFINAEPVTNNEPNLDIQSLNEETTVQVRITETSTGQSSLSNELVLTPLPFSFCNDVLSAEEEAIADFSIYPNPATERITVSLSGGASGTYSIIDLGGNRMASGAIDGGNIDVSGFAEGMYILSIQSKGQLVTKKFIKQSGR